MINLLRIFTAFEGLEELVPATATGLFHHYGCCVGPGMLPLPSSFLKYIMASSSSLALLAPRVDDGN